jgi:transcriptional/translational regulatory protein YebC/TACO1
MAGHSKWHNIKHRKAAQDAKKSKYYARIGKIIQIAAKDGPDPTMNPKLHLALQKAKQYNLPKDVIKKAIDK